MALYCLTLREPLGPKMERESMMSPLVLLGFSMDPRDVLFLG